MIKRDTDILVIGSGIAGLFYAIHCSRFARVLVVTKSGIGESNTMYAQGGIAAVTNNTDSIEHHILDTLKAGDGLCNEAAVRLVAEHAADCIAQLEEMSVRFDRDAAGAYDLHREGGHSHSRVVHASDATGREVESSLVRYLKSCPNIEVLEHHFVIDLLRDHSGCGGAFVYDADQSTCEQITSRITMLASGGGSQVYLHNTNPPIATGDGYALASRIGAELRDMEFVQFHPTSLYSDRPQTFLISEAVRGFGARLCHADGTEFMQKYHPLKSLAPRDVVSRAISSELESNGAECVFLDLRHLDIEAFTAHFPNISKRCAEEGLRLDLDLIPVVPAAHYFCGGVATDLMGRTTVPRLYACGEVACTGVHGANRLASNSLLEGLVFAEQASIDARKVIEYLRPTLDWKCTDIKVQQKPDAARERAAVRRLQIQQVMWNAAGIRRSVQTLQEGRLQLQTIHRVIEEDLHLNGFNVNLKEVLNLCETGLSICNAALERKQSVGCHWIVDSAVPPEKATSVSRSLQEA